MLAVSSFTWICSRKKVVQPHQVGDVGKINFSRLVETGIL